MTLRTPISTTILMALVAGLFGTGACNDSNPPSIRYTQEFSIYHGTGGDSGDSGTDSGSALACTDPVTDAAARPYDCSSNWLCSHPLCGVTVSGQEAIAKNVSCTSQDQQVCFKTCGPVSSGFKSETCTGGVYAEQPDCTFDSNCNFGCFKIPTVADATCPTTAITSGTPCTVSPCVVCGGNTNPGYISSGSQKAGYCVCPAETLKWSCATAGIAWPCPGNTGC